MKKVGKMARDDVEDDKSSAKWLSAEAVAAKRRRRRLERKRNRGETALITPVINQSRKDHMRSELEACTESRQRWTVAR